MKMPLSIGDRLGRYEILDPLGAGGMGEVYRARDTELDREVAIKVLPESVAGHPGRLARFEREAKSVATVAHPNILEIWDYGTDRGVAYAVTELLEGETLRDRLDGGGLGWRRAAEIGASIADGLATAHKAGIIHRDVKPSNIMLTADGRVKILDFGLARRRVFESGDRESGISTVAYDTTEGAIVGTVGYMSPEQVKGESVDGRSDIFSLGCVLYELVSGMRAFARDTAVETMAAILREEPEEIISITGVLVPVRFARTIERCLEKRPEARYQSASDLSYSLRTIAADSESSVQLLSRWRPGRVPTMSKIALMGVLVSAVGVAVWAPWGEKTQTTSEAVGASNRILVSPFINLTGDGSLESLGAMAADSMSHRFAETGVAEPIVVDGSSGPTSGSLTLNGAIYLDGDDIRLQVKLNDSITGDLVYALEPVTGSRASPGRLVEALSDRAVAAVATHFHPSLDIAVIRPPSSYEAFQHWRRGEEEFAADPERSIEHFERAIELDPNFFVARLRDVAAYKEIQRFTDAQHLIRSADDHLSHCTPFERAWLNCERSALVADHIGCYDHSREMLDHAKELHWVRGLVGTYALRLNRPQVTLDVIGPVARDPSFVSRTQGWGAVLALTSLLDACHVVGDFERELSFAEVALAAFPDVGDFYASKARAAAALGRVDEVVRTIDESMSVPQRWNAVLNRGEDIAVTASELRVHGHRSAAIEMANRAAGWFKKNQSEAGVGRYDRDWDTFYYGYSLCVADRWREAEEHFRELTRDNPGDLRYAGALGIVVAHGGDRREALLIVETLPNQDHPYGPAWKSYWCAAIHAHLGDSDRAMEFLRKSFTQGERHGPWHHQAMDLEPLWQELEFQTLIRPKG
jgi:serine/threonine protein kinase/tetratricopeptide (TPR) repeat protein